MPQLGGARGGFAVNEKQETGDMPQANCLPTVQVPRVEWGLGDNAGNVRNQLTGKTWARANL